MPYVLGIDLGNARMCAAVSQVSVSGWTPPEISCDIAAVLGVTGDGSFTVGEPMVPGPGVTARNFVSRLGDDVPLLLGGAVYPPQTLAAVLVTWAVERATAWLGEPPEHVVVSHPSGWEGYRRDLLRMALWEMGLPEVTLLPKPVAAAEAHPGRLIGVYALGRNGFATSAVRRSRTGDLELLGSLEGTRPLGSEDLLASLAVRTNADPQECARAIDELAQEAETEIRGTRIGRAEFDDLIAPAVRLTVDTLLRTVDLAGLRPDQLDEVLLIGWPAHLPLITDMIQVDFPCRITVAPQPRFAAALGAAMAAARLLATPAPAPPSAQPPPPERSRALEVPASHAEDLDAPPRPPVRISALKLPRRRSQARLAHARGFSLFGL